MQRGPHVRQDVVALLGGPGHHLELGVPLPEAVDELVDLELSRLDGGLVHPDATVLLGLQGEPGANLHRGGEPQRLALLQLADVDVGVGDRSQVVVAERPQVVGRQELVQELVHDVVPAKTGVDDLLGHLALSEPGDADVAGHLAIGPVQVPSELLGLDLNGQLHHVLVGFLHHGLHLPPSVLETRAS